MTSDESNIEVFQGNTSNIFENTIKEDKKEKELQILMIQMKL